MRRIWASVVSVWALLAVVAALAWQRPLPTRPPGQAPATTLIVKGKHGTTQRLVVVGTVGSAASHALTQTSPPPLG